MKGVSPGCVSVVCRFLMVSAFVMFRCFPMVMGGVGMMLRRFLVMFRGFLRHCLPPPFCLSIRNVCLWPLCYREGNVDPS
jgi:hypothetical protein